MTFNFGRRGCGRWRCGHGAGVVRRSAAVDGLGDIGVEESALFGHAPVLLGPPEPHVPFGQGDARRSRPVAGRHGPQPSLCLLVPIDGLEGVAFGALDGRPENAVHPAPALCGGTEPRRPRHDDRIVEGRRIDREVSELGFFPGSQAAVRIAHRRRRGRRPTARLHRHPVEFGLLRGNGVVEGAIGLVQGPEAVHVVHAPARVGQDDGAGRELLDRHDALLKGGDFERIGATLGAERRKALLPVLLGRGTGRLVVDRREPVRLHRARRIRHPLGQVLDRRDGSLGVDLLRNIRLGERGAGRSGQRREEQAKGQRDSKRTHHRALLCGVRPGHGTRRRRKRTRTRTAETRQSAWPQVTRGQATRDASGAASPRVPDTGKLRQCGAEIQTERSPSPQMTPALRTS